MPKNKHKPQKFSEPGQADFEVWNNQCVVVIHKTSPESDFVQIENKYLCEATANMKHSELAFYLYLVMNKDGYKKALSPSDYCEKMGMSKDSYYQGKAGLEKMGYLYFNKGTLYDTYDFYVHPSLNPHITSTV